jgi:3-methyl-2-oxobutanoate hydroxymethyltransferase
MSPAIIEVLAREGVPVICHVGLVPPKSTWTGGFRAVGKTTEQAKMIWRQVQAFEAAGAYAVELEVVPAPLASAISQRTSMVTISLGSGAGCDVQYLFSADLLGENRGHVPRHAKQYRDFGTERDRLQNERVAAYKEFIADVSNGSFPEDRHIVGMDAKALENIWAD